VIALIPVLTVSRNLDGADKPLIRKIIAEDGDNATSRRMGVSIFGRLLGVYANFRYLPSRRL
jgi:hypothetical protein